MKWHVLYTRHHHDRAVCDRLVHKGFEVYQPLLKVWRRSNGVSREAEFPLFARRLFVHCYLEMYTQLELITTPGVMHLLEDLPGQFLVVPDEEISTLRQIISAGVPLEEIPTHIQGKRVQVVQGPLRGVSGVIRVESPTTLLVPIHTLRKSIAVQIEWAQLIACADDREGSHGERPPSTTDSGKENGPVVNGVQFRE